MQYSILFEVEIRKNSYIINYYTIAEFIWIKTGWNAVQISV